MNRAARVALCRQHGVSRQLFHHRVQHGWEPAAAAATAPKLAATYARRCGANARHRGRPYEVGAFCLTTGEWSTLTGIPAPRLRDRIRAGMVARDVLRTDLLPRGPHAAARRAGAWP